MSELTSIEQKLRLLFKPQKLKLTDDSSKHRHHLQNPSSSLGDTAGLTHLHIYMVSSYFIGLNAVARARAVHKVLAEELSQSLHSVALKLKTPEEAC